MRAGAITGRQLSDNRDITGGLHIELRSLPRNCSTSWCPTRTRIAPRFGVTGRCNGALGRGRVACRREQGPEIEVQGALITGHTLLAPLGWKARKRERVRCSAFVDWAGLSALGPHTMRASTPSSNAPAARWTRHPRVRLGPRLSDPYLGDAIKFNRLTPPAASLRPPRRRLSAPRSG